MKRSHRARLLAALAFTLGTLTSTYATQATITHPVCHEDDACFDCATMGNRICGPLGVRLQQVAGDGWEVVYDPTTGVYTVEGKVPAWAQ